MESTKKPIRVSTSYLPSDPSKPARIRDVQLEYKTLQFIANLLQEVPKEDFDEWIRDGKILCKVFNALVFNSVPFDMVDSRDIEESTHSRVKALVNHIHEFGVPEEDLFHPRDLIEHRNIPRVCRCINVLRKMAEFTPAADADEEAQEDK